MRFRTKRDRLPGGHCGTRYPKNGSQKDTGSSGLVSANYRYRGTPIPGVHRVLSVFHSKLFKNRPTTLGSHEEDDPLALGPTPVQSLRNPKNPYVPETGSTPT